MGARPLGTPRQDAAWAGYGSLGHEGTHGSCPSPSSEWPPGFWGWGRPAGTLGGEGGREEGGPQARSPSVPTQPPLPRRYALLRIVNVEKRRDSARGSRFLLELELQERGGGRLRLSEYVFLRLPGAHAGGADADGESPEPAPAAPTRPDGRPELCRPLRLAWRQDVMVHFIVPGARDRLGPGHLGRGLGFPEPPRPVGAPLAVHRVPRSQVGWAQRHPLPPVKNQARWVAQFLADMAALHARTGDSHFSITLVDFESEDMDVEQALRSARLPR